MEIQTIIELSFSQLNVLEVLSNTFNETEKETASVILVPSTKF